MSLKTLDWRPGGESTAKDLPTFDLKYQEIAFAGSRSDFTWLPRKEACLRRASKFARYSPRRL
jgi:hypothetical protein